jgi:hypothetical protein
VGRGFGGGGIGRGFGRGQFASPGRAFARGFAGQRFAGTRRHFDHDRRFRRGFFFGPDWDYGVYDYACSYGYPYYTANYNCYPPSYY